MTQIEDRKPGNSGSENVGYLFADKLIAEATGILLFGLFVVLFESVKSAKSAEKKFIHRFRR